jgi:hypothetical protein
MKKKKWIQFTQNTHFSLLKDQQKNINLNNHNNNFHVKIPNNYNISMSSKLNPSHLITNLPNNIFIIMIIYNHKIIYQFINTHYFNRKNWNSTKRQHTLISSTRKFNYHHKSKLPKNTNNKTLSVNNATTSNNIN